MNGNVDPNRFAEDWVLAALDSDGSEVAKATSRALTAHVLLLYSNPQSEKLSTRDRNRFVRVHLSVYREMLLRLGFFETQAFFKKASLSFLRGFKTVGTKLFYELSDTVASTPINLCAAQLEGRELDVNGDDGRQIQFLLTWLVYLVKVPLPRPDLIDPAYKAWVERQVNPLPYTAAQTDIRAVRMIVSWLTAGMEFAHLGKHGPGTTASGAKTVLEKNNSYRPDLQSNQLIRFHVDDVDYGVSPREDAVWECVPKDVGSVRPITMEPSHMQYAQQGLKRDIYHAVDSRKVAAGMYLSFNDQTPSQVCALNGSMLTRNRFKSSTIDCRDASDRLRVDVITDIFTGDLLHYIMVGRSWQVSRKGRNRKAKPEVTQLSMYGGMGSALTFPVQSLAFLALTIWATISQMCFEETGVEATEDDISLYLDDAGFKKRHLNRTIRVFGDDIAIPDFAAERLVKLLKAFGLSVNVDKSFLSDSPVRESCGVYALGGRDITPKRYRIPVFGDFLDVRAFESIRENANAAFFMNYRYLHKYLISLARDTKKFMSSHEAFKRTCKGLVKEEKLEMADASLLYESPLCERDMIGFAAVRASDPEIVMHLATLVVGCTTFGSEVLTKLEEGTSYYHLTQAYIRMSTESVAEPVQGKSAYDRIPNGLRLVKRNAYIVESHYDVADGIWGWAPR